MSDARQIEFGRRWREGLAALLQGTGVDVDDNTAVVQYMRERRKIEEAARQRRRTHSL